MTAIEAEELVGVGFFWAEAGDTADDFFAFMSAFGSGSAHHEELGGEGKVDPAGGDGGGDDAAGGVSSAGVIAGAMGGGKKCAHQSELRFVF